MAPRRRSAGVGVGAAIVLAAKMAHLIRPHPAHRPMKTMMTATIQRTMQPRLRQHLRKQPPRPNPASAAVAASAVAAGTAKTASLPMPTTRQVSSSPRMSIRLSQSN
jgi:hypothetical protein